MDHVTWGTPSQIGRLQIHKFDVQVGMERWNNAEKKQWKISGIERPWGINRELVMRDPKKKTGNRYPKKYDAGDRSIHELVTPSPLPRLGLGYGKNTSDVRP